MFFSFFKVVYYFHFSIFLSLFDIKLFDVKLYHAGISLKKKTFRFLSESYSDNLITLRIFKAIWFKSFDNSRAYIKLNSECKWFVFCFIFKCKLYLFDMFYRLSCIIKVYIFIV